MTETINELEKIIMEQVETGNVKTTADFTEDDYDDWDDSQTDYLVEHLFEADAELAEGLKFDINKMKAGDIYLVNSFDCNGTAVDNSTHRILLIQSIEANKRENNEYFGFEFTTRLNQATVNNSARDRQVLIEDYTTILETGIPAHKPVVLELNMPVTFKVSDLAAGENSLLGHVTDGFMKFILDVIKRKIPATTIWNEETIKKYNNK